MSFPIQFARRTENSDFVSPIINSIGNAGFAVYVSAQLTVISSLALKALGFKMGEAITASVIATVGIGGAAAIHFGSLGLVLIAIAMAKLHREQKATA